MEARNIIESVRSDMPAPPADGQTGRNIIVCLDGTNNQFGRANTNVVKLVQVLDRTPGRQRVYYDPGVGTLAEPGALGIVRKWTSKIAGLAFGAGMDWKVQEAYTFLMDFWEPGDRLYLFGFSRGAYSVRVLAGLLYTVGLLPRGSYNLVPYAIRLYRAVRDQRSKDEKGDWKELCREFRQTFARQIKPGDIDRNFSIHFLGVWDTVSSVGWVWDPVKYPYTAKNPGIRTARHAISVDERRWLFRSNQLKPLSPSESPKDGESQNLEEHWFAGVHRDVGGGYPSMFENKFAELWREPFGWMLAEAKKAGLLLNDQRLTEVLGAAPEDPRPWGDHAHKTLTPVWWMVEFFPKRVWNSITRKNHWDIGRGRYRQVPQGALLHRSVLLRIRDNSLGYAPGNLSQRFRNEVAGLDPKQIPEFLAYTP